MRKMITLIIGIISVMLSMVFAVSAEIKRYDVPIGDSPSIGPDNAPVTIIEFLDYQ